MALGGSSLVIAMVALTVDIETQPAWSVALTSYAVFELCLVVAAVAVAVIYRWVPPRPIWWMCAAIAIAATIHFVAAAETVIGTSPLAGSVAAGWIVSNTAIAYASGSAPAPPSRSIEPRVMEISAPVAVGIAAIVLALGLFARVPPAALGFAGVTIVASQFRLAIASSALRRAVRQARLAETDELTGLRNRRALTTVARILSESVGSAESERTALLLLDLDRFKDVNDSFGHSAGDEVLRIVAQRLTDTTRDRDLIVRLGGDEFAILCPGTDEGRAVRIADRIAHKIAEPFTMNGQVLHIGVSIGIALAPDDGHDLDTILHHADTAMYKAKAFSRLTRSLHHDLVDPRHHRC